MAAMLDTPVDISLAATGAWTDIDISASCPVGTTGVIIRVHNTSTTVDRAFGLRKNGSTDSLTQLCYAYTQTIMFIGVDAGRILEGYILSTTLDFWLLGYFTSDAVFFDNGVNESLSALSEWTNIDLSGAGELPVGAVAAIFEIIGTDDALHNYGLEHGDMTDNRYTYVNAHTGFICGVNSSRICKGYIENAACDFYLVGYLIQGVFKTAGFDCSTGTTGSYQHIDVTADTNMPAGRTAALVHVMSTGAGYAVGIRKHGELVYDPYWYISRQACWPVQLDADDIFEGKISNVAIDFYVIGYLITPITTKTITDTGAGADSLGIAVSLSVADFGAGTDGPGIAAAVSVPDSGAGIDNQTIAVQVQIADSGAGSDGLTVSVNLGVVDSGSGLDAVSIISSILKTVQDTAIGTDVVGLNVSLAVADSGSGLDAVLLNVLTAVQDAGTGIDMPAVSVALTVPDSGQGLDALLTQILVTIRDSGLGSDLVGITVSLSVADAGAGLDAVRAFSDAGMVAKITMTFLRRNISTTIAQRGQALSLKKRTITSELKEE
jgi:hypothetical protein